MNKVLLATDFSERSDRALRRATLLAQQFGASLSIVHVVDDDQPQRIIDSERDAASTLLRELQSTVRNADGIPCDTRIVVAAPFAGIALAAQEIQPDLLVIGPHRRQTLRDVFVGTTAERTIRSVTCPVLMVNAPAVGAYSHVMLTTDLSEGAERAVEVCKTLRIVRDAQATILHVFDAPALHLVMSHTASVDERQAYLDDERQEASINLAAFLKSVDWQSLRQDVRPVRNSPAEEILTTAREESVDLIVVGTHGRSAVSKYFLGSVAEDVLRRSDRDVLTIPKITFLGE
jgi:nucleotide-binding universal stress UspA family protein